MLLLVFKKGLEKGRKSVKSQGIWIWILSGNPVFLFRLTVSTIFPTFYKETADFQMQQFSAL